MSDKNKLPASIRRLPKDQQAKALLHAAVAGSIYKQAGIKKMQKDLLALFDQERSEENQPDKP
jgi:hypothetical protein